MRAGNQIVCIFLSLGCAVNGRAAVTVEPPELSQLAGSFVGSVGGVTLQRLVLDEHGRGYLADVWFDAKGHHAEVYKVTLKKAKGFRVEATIQAVGGNATASVARGEADFFLIRLRIPETQRYRQRRLSLFREQTWQAMLDHAHGLQIGGG